MIIEYAKRFIGQPYIWGGEGPGFDCSGFVQECLRAVGKDPRGDQTAHALYEAFKENELRIGQFLFDGDLVFWPREGRKTHVAIAFAEAVEGLLPPNIYVIEAGGAGANSTTPETAQQHSAFVRIRPIEYRGDDYVVCRV